MTTRYRANRPENFPICETVDVGTINKLTSAEGCAFFRIYYGMDESMDVHAIMVAVDADGEDLLPPLEEADSSTGYTIVEDTIRCPPVCPPPSPLNSN